MSGSDRDGSYPEILDHLAEIVPALLFRADAEGKWVYVTERWRHFTGRAPNAALAAVVQPPILSVPGWLPLTDSQR